MLRIISVMCFFSVGILFSADIYVAPGGDDGNTGASGDPVREIREALTRVSPGDTIYVADGQYLGFDIDDIDGTAGNPITIQAQGSAAEITVTTDRPDDRDTIYISYSDYIIIDGLNMYNANRAGIRVSESDYVTIRNCVCGDNGKWGIFTDYADHVTLENNETYGSVDEHGIYHSNSADYPTIRGNLIYGNNANGIHMNGDSTLPGDGIISYALVEDNIIFNNGLGGGSAINCDGVQDSIIRNNLCYDAHGAGISLYQIDGAEPSKRNLVVNNTIDVASDGKWCLQIHNGSSDCTVFNNILLTNHASRGSLHFTSSADLVGLVCDYNILTDANDVATPDNDTTFLSLSEWQGMGYGEHSAISNQGAVFTDSASDDYTILSTGPAAESGVSSLDGKTAPLEDILGESRPGQILYDIGAYEYIPPTADGDGDGMPDWWEDYYSVDDPDDDPDGDGYTNLQEYENGTDPTVKDPSDNKSGGCMQTPEGDHGLILCLLCSLLLCVGGRKVRAR